MASADTDIEVLGVLLEGSGRVELMELLGGFLASLPQQDLLADISIRFKRV